MNANLQHRKSRILGLAYAASARGIGISSWDVRRELDDTSAHRLLEELAAEGDLIARRVGSAVRYYSPEAERKNAA